ncbi:MAG: M23 family metallopeptidase [Actinobacteria bacterium]|nr:M23 family metallopeptidase [Actinomycetota bacterium]
MEGYPTSTSGKYQLEYRHMDSIAVSQWDRVNRGTFVGKVGAKGNVQPPGACHLHLSMRKLSSDGSWYAVKPVGGIHLAGLEGRYDRVRGLRTGRRVALPSLGG